MIPKWFPNGRPGSAGACESNVFRAQHLTKEIGQIRLHSQYSRGKWGFIAEGQGRGSGWKPLRENIRGRGIPTEGRPG